MKRTWKYWLAAGSLLLTLGAGCAADVKQDAGSGKGTESTGNQGVPAGAEGSSTDTSMKPGAKGDDIDAAVDAAIKEADDQTSADMQENADANVVTNDSSELNAYGQAYDPSKL